MGGKKSVGIYASSTEINWVEMTKGGDQYELSQIVQQTSPPGTDFLALLSVSQDNLKSDVKSDLAQTTILEQLRDAFRVEENHTAYFSFSLDTMVLRYFKMLKIPRREWGTAVRFEARKYIPFNMEQMNSDFIVLPLQKESNEMGVVFFAVDHAQAQGIFLFLQGAGLLPKSSEASWISVLRLLRWNGQLADQKQSGFLISLEPTRMGIGLFTEGIPYFSREIKWSSSIINVDSPDLLENITGEIRLAQEFHRKNFQGKEINTAYTFGLWASEELNEKLSRECEVKAVKIDPYLRAGGEKPAVISSGTVASIGAALRGIYSEAGEPSIHLGGEAPEKRKKISPVTLLIAEAVFAIFILIATQLIASSQVRKARLTHDAIVTSRPVVTTVPNPLDTIEELEKIEQRYEQKILLLRAVIARRIDLTSKLSLLADFFPDPMWLQRFQWSETLPDDMTNQEREISIVGVVYSEAQRDVEIINSFSNQLKASEFFRGLSEAEILGVERAKLDFQEVSQFQWAGALKKVKLQKE